MASNTDYLDITKLKDIFVLLHFFNFSKSKWMKLGLTLDLRYNDLKDIEANHKNDVERCLMECLNFWLTKADVQTIQSLTVALIQIEEDAVANGIMKLMTDPASQLLQQYSDKFHQAALSKTTVQQLHTEGIISEKTAIRLERCGCLLIGDFMREVCIAVADDHSKLKHLTGLLQNSSLKLANDISRDYDAIFFDASKSNNTHVLDNSSIESTEETADSTQNSSNIVEIPLYSHPHQVEFDRMRNNFGKLLNKIVPLIEDNVPSIDHLKVVLKRCRPEMKNLLAQADSLDQVTNLIEEKCSLINVTLLEYLVDEYSLDDGKLHVEEYNKKLEQFCEGQNSLIICNDLQLKTFSTSHLKCETIKFTLNWEIDKHTLNDIRDLLNKSFGRMAHRVEVVVIKKANSISITCYAPHYLMESLLLIARDNLDLLKEEGLMSLTIGYYTVYDQSAVDEKVKCLEKEIKLLEEEKDAFIEELQDKIVLRDKEVATQKEMSVKLSNDLERSQNNFKKVQKELQTYKEMNRKMQFELQDLKSASKNVTIKSLPLAKAKKIFRLESHLPPVATGNIAAIDFGTSQVTVAYSLKENSIISVLKFGENVRNPNVILMKRSGDSIKVESIGTDAQISYATMKADAYLDCIYFQKIKMQMRRGKTINRQSLVESFSGEKFYLVEVVAFILKNLKELLLDTVKLRTTDFDWVITVPALWDARGKRMMREAAYLAGLLTESSGITQFTPVSQKPLPLPNETNSEKLSLALEPEAAAFYCQDTYGTRTKAEYLSQFLVVDIGGGTVDITAHVEKDGGVIVENIPTGIVWGGTQVNEAFSKILQNIVNDPGFNKFLCFRNNSQQKAFLNKLFYFDFESQKILFGQCKHDTIAVDLKKIEDVYGSELVASIEKEDDMSYESDTLYIEEKLIKSEFFDPAVDNVIANILSIIESNKKINISTSTIYLVGGFGGCKYVRQKFKQAIEQSKSFTCDVVVPPYPTIAVAQGAVLWRRDPEKVKARQVDATYGLSVQIPFEYGQHDMHYKCFNESSNEYECKSVFQVFMEKGEKTFSNEVMSTTIYPTNDSDTQIAIKLYSTTSVGIQYTEDKSGIPTVSQIGQLIIDIPSPKNLPKDERGIDLLIDFSGTEIQAKAKYIVTGEELNTICDLLSEV